MTVAIITGAGSGMGRASAERFAAEGWTVATFDLTPQKGSAALELAVDVTDPTALEAAVARVATELGSPSALVNAAGIYPPTTLATTTVSLYRRTFDVNVLGTLLVTQAVVPQMSNGGSIVNFASIDAFVPSPGQLVYCASKAAVVALTRSLALELAPRIRVNALAPGWVDTPGNVATGRMEAVLAHVPLRRAATAEEMADLVWFLGGEQRAQYVTGETLVAAGGLVFR